MSTLKLFKKSNEFLYSSFCSSCSTVSQIERSVLTISEISAKKILKINKGRLQIRKGARQNIQKLISGGIIIWNWRVHWLGAWGSLSKSSIVLVMHFFPECRKAEADLREWEGREGRGAPSLLFPITCFLQSLWRTRVCVILNWTDHL